jgi:hypothetical protein
MMDWNLRLIYVKICQFLGFESSKGEMKDSLGLHNLCFYLVLNLGEECHKFHW